MGDMPVTAEPSRRHASLARVTTLVTRAALAVGALNVVAIVLDGWGPRYF